MLPSVISGNFIDAKDRSMFVLSSDFLSLAFMNVVILVLLCPIPATWSSYQGIPCLNIRDGMSYHFRM